MGIKKLKTSRFALGWRADARPQRKDDDANSYLRIVKLNDEDISFKTKPQVYPLLETLVAISVDAPVFIDIIVYIFFR